jgi:hypothetical protein
MQDLNDGYPQPWKSCRRFHARADGELSFHTLGRPDACQSHLPGTRYMRRNAVGVIRYVGGSCGSIQHMQKAVDGEVQLRGWFSAT